MGFITKTQIMTENPHLILLARQIASIDSYLACNTDVFSPFAFRLEMLISFFYKGV